MDAHDSVDVRSETDRTPGPYKPPAHRGEYRNIYRRADGSERHGPTWSTQEAAGFAREVLDGETFVECRDMRNATDMAPTGSAQILSPETAEA